MRERERERREEREERERGMGRVTPIECILMARGGKEENK
jgi:hypothetical protein